MRKLFALVATMAMVLSMFAGVAFATSAVHTIKLDSYLAAQTGADHTIAITGRIVDANGALVAKNFVVKMFQGTQGQEGYVEFTGIAQSGMINMAIPGNAAVGAYTVVASATDGDTAVVELDASNNIKTFTVTYKMAATGTIGWTWGDTGDFMYVGALTGVTSGNVELWYAGGTAALTSAPVNANGQFVFLLGKKDAMFSKPGKLQLKYNGVVLAEGTIKAAAAAFTGTTSVVYGFGQPVAFEFDIDDIYVPTSATVAYEILIKSGDTTKWSWNTQEVAATINPVKADAGTYKLIANIKINGATAYTKEQSFTVSRPDSINLIGLAEKATVAAGYNFTIGGSVVVTAIDRYGAANPADKYDVFATGAGVNVEHKGVTPNTAVNLVPKMGGTINVTINAYEYNTTSASYVKIASFTRSIVVEGGVATMTPDTLEIKQASTITISVKDQNGVPVNNALIGFDLQTADGAYEIIIDSTTTNPQGGVYTYKVTNTTFTTPGKYNVDVFRYVRLTDGTVGTELIARAGVLNITGQHVYNVTLGKTEVLAGQDEEVIVTVKEGDAFRYPYSITITSDDKDDTYSETLTGMNTRVDTNNDGILDSFKVTMPAAWAGGAYTVTVADSATGTKIGSAALTVVEPVLNIDVEKMTNRTNSKMTFTVVDPRDNTVLDWNVSIAAVYASIEDAYEFEYAMPVTSNAVAPMLVDEPYQVTLLVDANYTAAKNAKTVPTLVFTVENVESNVYGVTVDLDKTIEIADPSFTVDPTEIVAGVANDLTFTLVDANGVALEGYDVYRGETKIGTTNADGEVNYTITQVGIDPVEFNVELDYTWTDNSVDYVAVKTAKVSPVYDNVKPVIGDVPVTTDKGSVELTISDNVRVATIYVNGVAKPFVPGAEAKINLALAKGDNVFHVIAIDASGNGVEKMFTVNYTPVVKSVVLQGTQVERKGANLFVQIRQFEDLGATFKWDAATKTAEFVYGTTTVKVTVGSTTATVNGVAKTMPAAPYLVSGRTMVPTRFISEALGWKVDWQTGDIVTITLP